MSCVYLLISSLSFLFSFFLFFFSPLNSQEDSQGSHASQAFGIRELQVLDQKSRCGHFVMATVKQVNRVVIRLVSSDTECVWNFYAVTLLL